MREPTDRSPLDRMVSFIDETAPGDAATATREFALILDAEGVLDGLDDHDGRHVVGAVLVDLLVNDSGDQLRARADWIDSGNGAWALHNPAGAAAALRRIAEVLDLPGGGDRG